VQRIELQLKVPEERRMVLSDHDADSSSLGNLKAQAAKEFKFKFSEKPFLGARLGTSSAPYIRANFNPKVEWHSAIAPWSQSAASQVPLSDRILWS
jgi:hypothetical protein